MYRNGNALVFYLPDLLQGKLHPGSIDPSWLVYGFAKDFGRENDAHICCTVHVN